MSLTIGTLLGSHEIRALLGKGGMGEVYRARDTKLKREVAIKILPDEFARDSDRVSRFQREAEVLASLNHPGIATIYDLQEASGLRYLVLELVEGDTLADRLKRSPFSVEEALNIAKSICEALEAAHEKGIVHRDMKPANVKITPDGKAKVLDFGLAKAIEAGPASAVLSNSPTMLSGTMGGHIIGTAAYMSPEQAKGRPVDRRTDIFAFGCVLFEMLSGRPAFDGEDVTEILAQVVTREPDWDRLPASVPKRVRELLRLCLQKDTKRRRRDAGDLILDIDQIMAELSNVAPVAIVQSPSYPRVAWIAAMVFAVVAIVAIAFQFRSAPTSPEMRLDITARAMRYPAQFALSPDGLSVVYSASTEGTQRLWLRRLDRVEAQPLAGTEGGGLPFWAPDSRSIGFVASNRLFTLDLDSGPPRLLTGAGLATGGAWNQDGVILFAPLSLSGPLFRIPASGGEAVPVTKLDASINSSRIPRFLPDGKHFLFYVVGRPDQQGVYLGSLDGTAPKRLTPADAHGEYVEPGYVAFINQGVLLARRLDLKRGELTGPTQTIADSVPYTAAVGLGAYSVSASGRIAYQVGAAARRQLMWYDRRGTAKPAAEADVNELQSAELSPDGRRVALDRTVQGNRDIFLFDLLRGNTTRFTFEPAQDGLPVWSPDSMRIAFESKRKGPYDLYVKMASGAVAEQPLLESDHDKWPTDWSKDGSYLMYYENDPITGGNLFALPMDGSDKKPVVIANSPFEERNGQFSPDGQWVAYETNKSRRPEIVVQSFPVPSSQWQVSNSGGTQPRWRRNGTELYFIGPDLKMMAVPIKISSSRLEPTIPVALFQTRVPQVPKPQYAVSTDGRFLVNEQVEDPAANSITLILNWHPK